MEAVDMAARLLSVLALVVLLFCLLLLEVLCSSQFSRLVGLLQRCAHSNRLLPEITFHHRFKKPSQDQQWTHSLENGESVWFCVCYRCPKSTCAVSDLRFETNKLFDLNELSLTCWSCKLLAALVRIWPCLLLLFILTAVGLINLCINRQAIPKAIGLDENSRNNWLCSYSAKRCG